MTPRLDIDHLTLGDNVEHLKCTKCTNFLSIFPIYLSKNMDNVCSRCYGSNPKKDNYIHNEVYETVAQFFMFPCRYKKEGCAEEFLPKDIIRHEENCSYKLIKCPTASFTNCDWEGTQFNVMNHCQDKHANIFLKNGEFDIDLAQSHTSNNLVHVNSALIIVSRVFDARNKMLEFVITNVEEWGNGTPIFDIQFKTTKRNHIIQCNAKENVTESLDSFKNHDIIHCTISSPQTDRVAAFKNEIVDREMLKLLECNFCHNYAKPPIYSYLLPRMFQKEQLTGIRCQNCPRTLVSIGNNTKTIDLRDYGLEKLSFMLNYPCKFEKNGCSFVAKSEIMKRHQDFCLYGEHSCPLGEYVECKWIGKNVNSHIEDSHQDMFREMCSEIFENVENCPTVKCYIIKYDNALFQVSVLFDYCKLSWSVQIIRETDPCIYKFELTIIKEHKILTTRGLCCAWNKKDKGVFDHACNVDSLITPIGFCTHNKQRVNFSPFTINFTVKITKRES